MEDIWEDDDMDIPREGMKIGLGEHGKEVWIGGGGMVRKYAVHTGLELGCLGAVLERLSLLCNIAISFVVLSNYIQLLLLTYL
jgi:hypothetical protein